jgi:hypothetical protein
VPKNKQMCPYGLAEKEIAMVEGKTAKAEA